MTLPINQVIPGKIEYDENGWKCGICEYRAVKWRSVLGHMNKHRPSVAHKKTGIMTCNVHSLSIDGIINLVDELREEVRSERRENNALRALLKSVVNSNF